MWVQTHMIRWLFLFIVCKSKHHSSDFTLCAQEWISLSGISRWSPPLESNCTCISQAVAAPGQAFFISLILLYHHACRIRTAKIFLTGSVWSLKLTSGQELFWIYSSRVERHPVWGQSEGFAFQAGFFCFLGLLYTIYGLRGWVTWTTSP